MTRGRYGEMVVTGTASPDEIRAMARVLDAIEEKGQAVAANLARLERATEGDRVVGDGLDWRCLGERVPGCVRWLSMMGDGWEMPGQPLTPMFRALVSSGGARVVLAGDRSEDVGGTA